ncbi:terminase small subunit [Anaerostipes caccae L1-92]|nr:MULTISPECIES: terminase small subunit [Anaerostipes]QMW70265.1 phage portal protein [Anaerostipes caccae L1-92]UWN71079.1 terminase small subunit [Anaerostipes caccae L1-92]CDC34416.1 terminase small subunit [Anaerostipes sp. CAG:276]
MPRSRSPDSIKAERMYKSGMNLVDIAKEIGKPPGTVRRWKSTQGWDSERSGKKANVRKQETEQNIKEREAIAPEVEQVIDNPNLTDKQRLFCCLYIKCFNATKAYRKAYGCSYETALTNGPGLLRNTRIKEEIQRLKQGRLNKAMLEGPDVFQWYLDIARADITDFTDFGNMEIETDNGPMTISYVNIKDAREVDGTLLSEVSKGKDGVKVKLADRMKAMQWISDHMDLATPEQKEKVKLLQAQRRKLEDDGPEETEDDGFIEALKGQVDDLWQEE